MHAMTDEYKQWIKIDRIPDLQDATLVLAFSGWMDGGDVSTGTVERLVDLLEAERIAEIDYEPFYLFNFPGSMEVTAMFRPNISIADGLVESIEMPANEFFVNEEAKLVLFIGKEPNLRWRMFGDCIFHLAQQVGIRRIVFVGSFGGAIPHTREPRLYVVCSSQELLAEMQQYGVRRTGYDGPGSFVTYLMSQTPAVGLEMVSLVAEIPGYLQGSNPASIEAVTRRLAKIFHLPLDLASLRSVSTDWEIEVSTALEDNEELTEQIRKLEEDYDNDLLDQESDAL